MTFLRTRDLPISKNPTAVQSTSLLKQFFGDGNITRSLDELRDTVTGAVTTHYNNLIFSLSDKFPTNPMAGRKGFGSIHPYFVHAGVAAAGYFSRNYPRIHPLLEKTAYLHFTHSACQAIGLRTAVGLSTVLTLAERFLPKEGYLKKIMDNSPPFKNVLQKARYASYASIAWTLASKLASKGYNDYTTYLATPPKDRLALLQKINGAGGEKSVFEPYDATASTNKSVPNHHDTKLFGASVKSLNTTNMVLTDLMSLAELAVHRDKQWNQISEKAIWGNLTTNFTAYNGEVVRNIAQAEQRVSDAKAVVGAKQTILQTLKTSLATDEAELVRATNEANALDMPPFVPVVVNGVASIDPLSLAKHSARNRVIEARAIRDAARLALTQSEAELGLLFGPLHAANVALNKVKIEQLNRQFTYVHFQRQHELSVLREAKPKMDTCVFQARVHDTIFQAFQGTPQKAINSLIDLAAQVMSKKEKEILWDTLNAPIQAIPGWDDQQKSDFMLAVFNGDRVFLTRAFLRAPAMPAGVAGPALPALLTNETLQVLRVATLSYSNKLLGEVNRILDPISVAIKQNIDSIDPSKLARMEETNEQARLTTNVLELWTRDGQDAKIIDGLNKQPRMGKVDPLFGDVVTTIDPMTQQIFVAQFRTNGTLGTGLDIASILGKNSTDCVENSSGEKTLAFRYSIQEMIYKIIRTDLERLTFEEELVPVYNPLSGWELHYKKASTADLEDASNRLSSPQDLKTSLKTPLEKRLTMQANANHRLTGEVFRSIGKHLISEMIKKFVDGTIIKEDLATLRRTITFLDVINNNHFVNKLKNTPDFTQHDEDYRNHATIYKRYIRGAIVEQLGERQAIEDANQVVVGKTGTLFPVSATQVDVNQSRAFATTIDKLHSSMYMKESRSSDKFQSVIKAIFRDGSMLEETNLRKNSFQKAFLRLDTTLHNLKKITRSGSRVIEACVMPDREGNLLLQSLYRDAYFLKLALENRSVRKTILPLFQGGEDQAAALLKGINQCISGLSKVYEDTFNQMEFGVDINLAKALKAQKKAKEIGEIQANSEFRLNAFEKEALSFGDSALTWVGNLF